MHVLKFKRYTRFNHENFSSFLSFPATCIPSQWLPVLPGSCWVFQKYFIYHNKYRAFFFYTNAINTHLHIFNNVNRLF